MGRAIVRERGEEENNRITGFLFLFCRRQGSCQNVE